jgi:hypothetical protein
MRFHLRRIATLTLAGLVLASVSYLSADAQIPGGGGGTPSNPTSVRSGQYGVPPAVAPQYCQITSLSAATKLLTANCATGTILSNSTIAQICVETQAVRYTSSGVVTPTASIGMPVSAGTCFQYAGPLTTIQFIQQSAGAVLDVETFP